MSDASEFTPEALSVSPAVFTGALQVVLLRQYNTLLDKLHSQVSQLAETGDVKYWNSKFTEFQTTLQIASSKAARDHVLVYQDHSLLENFPSKKRKISATPKPKEKKAKKRVEVKEEEVSEAETEVTVAADEE